MIVNRVWGSIFFRPDRRESTPMTTKHTINDNKSIFAYLENFIHSVRMCHNDQQEIISKEAPYDITVIDVANPCVI